MNNKLMLGLGALVVIIIGIVVLVMMPPKANAPSDTPTNTPATNKPGSTNTGNTNPNTSGNTPVGTTPAPVIKKANIPNLITADIPVIGAKISSPVSVVGSARGAWYSEATFPIEIKNGAGVVIGTGQARAQGEWQTDNFVQFISEVIFQQQPAGSKGTVVLKKDNPSGDPARDQSVEIAVTF